jgi:hypothetical protein
VLLAKQLLLGAAAFVIASVVIYRSIAVYPEAAASIRASIADASAAREDAEVIERAKNALGLLDPYSAHFDEIRVIPSEGGKKIVCGFVNAKNRFGAYVGRKPFAYRADYAAQIVEGDPPLFQIHSTTNPMAAKCFPWIFDLDDKEALKRNLRPVR